MATTIEVKLRTAAALNAGLTALLGTSPFRWYDLRLIQNSAFPAVTVQMISRVPRYAFDGRNLLDLYRVQFTAWDLDSENARAVAQAIVAFLDTFSAVGNATQYPNQVALSRQSLFAEMDPPVYQVITDAMIYADDSL